MRIKKITLNNFRCFEHLELNLHPRLTVFVGENGAGKTAVLDGIATALSPVLTHLSSANQRLTGCGIKDSDFRLESWAGKSGKERWGAADFVQVKAETWDGLAWDYWRPSSTGKEPPQKCGVTDLKNHLLTIANSYKTSEPNLTPVLAYYGARRGHIEVPKRLRGAKENYDYPASALIGALDSMSDFREMLAWFDLEESSELRANKGVVSDDFEESLTLAAVRAAVVELLGGAFQNPHFNKDHKFVLEQRNGGTTLLINQLSQGYQSMLALAMDFSRRLAIANGHLAYGDGFAQQVITEEIGKLALLDPVWSQQAEPPFQSALTMSAPAIMLVDEIDLHLHPSWQQRVLNDLMRTYPLTQFIVTTHSPQVLTSVDASCIRVLHQTPETGKQQTVIERITLQTRGVASSDLLAQIMGVDPIPDVPEARMLSEYHALIQQNLHEGAQGNALRTKLEAHFGIDHPVMRECDRMIRLQAFKQKLPLPKRSD